MTPREKALELYNKMAIEFVPVHTIPYKPSEFVTPINQYTKQCALISAGEVLDHVDMVGDEAAMSYWQEVKQEIEKL